MAAIPSRNWKQYLATIAIFLVCGGTIGAAAYVSFLPREARTVLKVATAAATLAAWLISRERERLHPYRPILLGFFSVSIGLLLAQFFGTIPLRLLGWSVATARGIAMAKLGEALAIALSILVTHFAAGGNRDGLFLRGGRLKLGLTVGVLAFAAFAAIAAVQAMGSGLSWGVIAAELPWISIFVLSNAFMEELWFRALFLKKLEPLVGGTTAIASTALVFALVHISSTYVIDIGLFLVALMALGLLWGWLMRKSDSIWGSVLMHAGADVLVMMGFLAGGGL
jgi:membrane protease YdiL (CAAX protease family)